MKKFLWTWLLVMMFGGKAHAFDSGSAYNSANMSYAGGSQITQIIVFNNAMKSGGTITFNVDAHGGGGRPLEHDTGNIKMEFYNSSGTLLGNISTNYSQNLLQMNAWSTGPGDNSAAWVNLNLSTSTCGTAGSCSNVAYMKIIMEGTDGSWWAGDYGAQWRLPSVTFNGGSNIVYNPEFASYNGTMAQGWTSSTGWGVCGTTSGSVMCTTQASGVTVNMSAGGYSATGGTTSGTEGGYTGTLSATNPTGAPAGPTVTGTTTTYTTRTTTSGTTTYVYRTPVTTTTYSDNSTTVSNGTEALYQTKVSSNVVTNKIVDGTLTTYTTPVLKVTPADGSARFLEANGAQTISTQTVQQGLTAEVFRYDPKNYTCVFGLCAWNLTYHTPSTNRGDYGNPVNTYRTTNGIFFATNTNLPNNDNSLLGRNDGTVIRYTGTITAPITTAHPAGDVYRLYFYNNSDDGFRMWVNGVERISQNTTVQLQSLFGYTSSGYMDVVAGQTYNLEAWYWNTYGGLGQTLYWDYGTGMTAIYNTAFTTGTIGNIDVDTTGLSYSDPTIVPTSGTAMSTLCCGGSAEPFNGNPTYINMTTQFVNRASNDSQVYVQQIGDNNSATVTQTGTKNNYAYIYEHGSSNNVSVTQTGNASTAVNFSYNSVNGSFNTVNITQTSTGGAKGSFVSVTDNNNSVTVNQSDSGSHYAEVGLSGGNKSVNISQSGSASHMASIYLSGLPTSLTLQQSGATQNFYSIQFNCATAGGCSPITVKQGN